MDLRSIHRNKPLKRLATSLVALSAGRSTRVHTSPLRRMQPSISLHHLHPFSLLSQTQRPGIGRNSGRTRRRRGGNRPRGGWTTTGDRDAEFAFCLTAALSYLGHNPLFTHNTLHMSSQFHTNAARRCTAAAELGHSTSRAAPRVGRSVSSVRYIINKLTVGN